MRWGVCMSADCYDRFLDLAKREGLSGNNLIRKMLGAPLEHVTRRGGGIVGFRPDRLASVIAAQGLSLEEVSFAAGLSSNAVWQITSGHHSPRPATLEAVCAVLGIRSDEVIDEAD